MQIYIEPITGRNIILDCEHDDTVLLLKTKLHDVVKMPMNMLILVGGGKRLENNTIIHDIPYVKYTSLRLVIRLNVPYDEDWATTYQYFPDEFHANIIFPYHDFNEVPPSMKFQRSNTVFQMKKKIEREWNVFISDCTRRDVLLQDHLYLGGYDFINSDNIMVNIDDRKTQLQRKKRVSMVELSRNAIYTDCVVITSV
jgi:hypothetical protein